MTGVSTLGQALRNLENIKSQQSLFSDLSTQLATGKKTQSYTGLGTDVLASIRARTEFTSIEVYSNNITRSNTRIGIMLNSIEEFQAQARQFSKTQTTLVQQGAHQEGDDVIYDDPGTSTIETTIVGKTSGKTDNDLQSVVNHAENLYGFLTELMNTKDGDRYVMAGADSLTKPINDAGTLDAAVGTLITNWKNGTITTDELIADIKGRSATTGNPDAITDTVIGYSASLSSGKSGSVYVRTAENSEINYTALANEEGFRDIIVAMAFLKNENLTPVVDVYADGVYPGVPSEKGAPGANSSEQQDNFYKVFQELSTMVSRAVDQIDQVRGRLETVRAQTAQITTSNKAQKTLLLNTVASVEDVDPNEVAVKLTALQTQLEASFQVTAMSGRLSLINFL
jgi:flagellar hook-associated protein 3 FlgL